MRCVPLPYPAATQTRKSCAKQVCLAKVLWANRRPDSDPGRTHERHGCLRPIADISGAGPTPAVTFRPAVRSGSRTHPMPPQRTSEWKIHQRSGDAVSSPLQEVLLSPHWSAPCRQPLPRNRLAVTEPLSHALVDDESSVSCRCLASDWRAEQQPQIHDRDTLPAGTTCSPPGCL